MRYVKLMNGVVPVKLLQSVAMRPEHELLVHCARVKMSPATAGRIKALVEGGLDWSYLSVHAYRHGLVALVHKHVQATCPEVAAVPAFRPLKQQARQQALDNLRRVRAFREILRRFEAQGIPVIGFKGFMLGELVYGDASLREFGDFDILVPREQLTQAKALLLEEGFRPWRDLTPEEEAAHLDSQMGYEFVDEARRLVVELHWSFLNTCHAFGLDPEQVFARAEQVALGSETVRNFAPEDLLIYLCAHGTKHLWERLNWICDIAEFVRARRDIDWERTIARARQLGSRRMLFLGLYLAHELLDAPLPPEVARRVRADRVVPSLAHEVCQGWLFREPDAPPVEGRIIFYFLLRTRERLRDRIPYLLYNARLAAAPSEQDRALIDLPDVLTPLYVLVRPIRVLKDRIAGTARA